MAAESLQQIYHQHCGKVSDKWSLYLSEYDRLLAVYRNQPVRLLEIGIQNGGSLEIWFKYFSHIRKAVGCDINPKCSELSYPGQDIVVITGDANCEEIENKILAEAEMFDIIIDDGSHRSDDIYKTFSRYFSYLETNGLYIVEDLHCSYWKDFAGGIHNPLSSMAFFKRLADVINYESWCFDAKRVDLMESFYREYGDSVDESLLEMVHSVEFINSMCVIRKALPAENRLGLRVQAGTDASVIPVTSLSGTFEDIVHGQSDETWHFHSQTPEEDLVYLQTENHNLQEKNLKLQEKNLAACQLNHDLMHELELVLNSFSWSLTSPLRKLGQLTKKAISFIDFRNAQPAGLDNRFQSGISAPHEPEKTLARLRDRLSCKNHKRLN